MANIKTPPSIYMLNLQHVLDPYTDEDKKVINGIVEINSNTINKYELITESGQLKLDRVGYSSLTYPVAYGAIPQTWDHDGDLLDFVIANVTEPLIPGSLVEARIIGIMRFEDGGEIDDKVVTVINDDKRMDHIQKIEDLGGHWVKEVGYYFEHYKDLKKPGTCIVKGFFDATEAVKIIDECAERYQKDYAPKLEEFEEDMHDHDHDEEGSEE
ncbi:MAG: inorganic diphosphatase [Candidatus Dojkabacteria bacterium]